MHKTVPKVTESANKAQIAIEMIFGNLARDVAVFDTVRDRERSCWTCFVAEEAHGRNCWVPRDPLWAKLQRYGRMLI